MHIITGILRRMNRHFLAHSMKKFKSIVLIGSTYVKHIISPKTKFPEIVMETICFDPSSEPSQRDGSDEGPQYMFLCKTNQNIPNYHQIPPLI